MLHPYLTICSATITLTAKRLSELPPHFTAGFFRLVEINYGERERPEMKNRDNDGE